VGADLLVLGTHGRVARGNRIGSTADRVLRTSSVPCLVVRGNVRFPVRRIAAASDFSNESGKALSLAADWLEVLGGGRARLDLIHAGNQGYRALDPGVEELCEAILEGEVTRIAKEAALDRSLVNLHLEWSVHPVDGIVSALEGGGQDLVVVGTHGHGRVRRTLLGGVTVALAQRSPCPVLVAPS
jgi:nucleotide-binding universal stress UspA family protein